MRHTVDPAFADVPEARRAAQPRRGPRPLAPRLLLAALLILAFSLRLWTAHVGLHKGRFWDERFSIQNVVHTLETGQLSPWRAFYGSLSYLPYVPFLATSQWLHRASGLPILKVVEPPGDGHPADRLTPTGYLILRAVTCGFGTLSIYLCYVVATSLLGQAAGLWAAAFLALVPWHVRQSAVFKPDVVLVAALLFAFWLALRASYRAEPRWILAAGAGVGVAASAKLNGAPIAIVLVAGLLARRHFDRRTLVWLVAAGIAAVATFFALNPWLLADVGAFRRDFGDNTLGIYLTPQTERQGSAVEVAWSALPWLAGGLAHGWAIALLALAGATLLVVRAARSRFAADEPATLAAATLLSFLLVYWLGYSSVSRNLTAWRAWLFLTPFTAILAAAGTTAGWRHLRDLLPTSARRPAAALLALALLVPATRSALTLSYVLVVPSTTDLAVRHLARQLGDLDDRFIASEAPFGALERRAQRSALLEVESLHDLDHLRLDLLDAEVFGSRWAALNGDVFYQWRARKRSGVARRAFESRWMEARGEDLFVVLHPWKREAQRKVRLTRRGAAYVGRLPRCRDSAATSVSFRLEGSRAAEPELSLARQPLPLHPLGARDAPASWFASERVPCTARKRRLEISAVGRDSERPLKVLVTVWAPPYPGNWASRADLPPQTPGSTGD